MPAFASDFNHNQPVYSVSEISLSIKRVLEDHFGVVRLRGEVSGWRGAHSSGHAYFSLKDDQAVINAVCWKGVLGKLQHKPEEGLEVIATGRISAYNGKYQLVVEHIEPAGVGALMALLEKRRKQFEAEGLFKAERKKPLPFLPRTIGVITSPTGAVIRDILHRLGDRFPVHVIVWPVAVQGEGAKEQIAEAINGFNELPTKPDLLIVARGGGSIEDLWAFNEEIVVRAVAASSIPLISAVGHETDTTLIDYVSDRRAPTPSAAAEMAVPVREELLQGIHEYALRLRTVATRLFEQSTQRLDDWSERLVVALPAMITRKAQQLATAAAALPMGLKSMDMALQRLEAAGGRLTQSLPAMLARKEQQLAVLIASLKPRMLFAEIETLTDKITDWQKRMQQSCLRGIDTKWDKLQHLSALLESVNYQKVLARGFALVRDEKGKLVSSVAAAKQSAELSLTFKDGEVKAKPIS